MRYSGLDTAFRLPSGSPTSSSAFRYHRAAHLSAAASEVTRTPATTSAAPRCPRTDYLHGFRVREELKAPRAARRHR